MNNLALKVEHLSKKYTLRGRRTSSAGSLKALLNKPLQALYQSISGGGTSPSKEVIWALKDVSFEIEQGEAVGFVGKNGAGKSTLLKILSRITYPTEGKVTMYQQVSSLLEMGTGFNPDLSGRDNVYLNGSLLGMSHAEINRKYDEIVAFSEIEPFIDMPVKYYSSGMFVRLAFSVAAHLSPELLLLDEVLSVGDAAFQVKSLQKMKELLDQGSTLIYVSHNLQAVVNMCQRVLYLEDGKIVMDGPAKEVVDAYWRKTLQDDGVTPP